MVVKALRCLKSLLCCTSSARAPNAPSEAINSTQVPSNGRSVEIELFSVSPPPPPPASTRSSRLSDRESSIASVASALRDDPATEELDEGDLRSTVSSLALGLGDTTIDHLMGGIHHAWEESYFEEPMAMRSSRAIRPVVRGTPLPDASNAHFDSFRGRQEGSQESTAEICEVPIGVESHPSSNSSASILRSRSVSGSSNLDLESSFYASDISAFDMDSPREPSLGNIAAAESGSGEADTTAAGPYPNSSIQTAYQRMTEDLDICTLFLHSVADAIVDPRNRVNSENCLVEADALRALASTSRLFRRHLLAYPRPWSKILHPERGSLYQLQMMIDRSGEQLFEVVTCVRTIDLGEESRKVWDLAMDTLYRWNRLDLHWIEPPVFDHPIYKIFDRAAHSLKVFNLYCGSDISFPTELPSFPRSMGRRLKSVYLETSPTQPFSPLRSEFSSLTRLEVNQAGNSSGYRASTAHWLSIICQLPHLSVLRVIEGIRAPPFTGPLLPPHFNYPTNYPEPVSLKEVEIRGHLLVVSPIVRHIYKRVQSLTLDLTWDEEVKWVDPREPEVDLDLLQTSLSHILTSIPFHFYLQWSISLGPSSIGIRAVALDARMDVSIKFKRPSANDGQVDAALAQSIADMTVSPSVKQRVSLVKTLCLSSPKSQYLNGSPSLTRCRAQSLTAMTRFLSQLTEVKALFCEPSAIDGGMLPFLQIYDPSCRPFSRSSNMLSSQGYILLPSLKTLLLYPEIIQRPTSWAKVRDFIVWRSSVSQHRGVNDSWALRRALLWAKSSGDRLSELDKRLENISGELASQYPTLCLDLELWRFDDDRREKCSVFKLEGDGGV
ncbi:hypothetical protein BKA70DRAFT_1417323 [Coprinopsis sp. MPI-PUGE-AT-0042]|nr:hypothetical protein BKA70DRAFT_1417323 [Coprinopsis sp. MPI-PUGE-AT-0042]